MFRGQMFQADGTATFGRTQIAQVPFPSTKPPVPQSPLSPKVGLRGVALVYHLSFGPSPSFAGAGHFLSPRDYE